MKSSASLRAFLACFGCSLLGILCANATTFYWDQNGTTLGFGTGTGTWAEDDTSPGPGRWTTSETGILAGSLTQATDIADTFNFGTAANGLAAGTITVSGTVDMGNLSYGSSSGAIVLSGGIINLAAAQTTTVNNATNTISSVLAGAGTSFTKAGSGILILSGANTYAGTTIINRGTLTLNSQTGSLATTSPLTFTGTGTFNMDNVGASGALTQTLGALTFSAGQGTVQTTRTAAFDQAITFASLAARTAGASGNFVNTGTNSATNGFIFTAAPAAGTLIDRGIFYNGSSYATYDAGGFVRGFTAGDTNYLAAPTGATIGASTSASNVDLTTGNITAQTTVSANTINMRANSITMSGTNQVLSANGILSSGSASATLGGGTTPRLQATAAGNEIVIRVNGASDSLTVTSAIRNFGVDSGGTASGLTKTGSGTLSINTASTFTGALNVNSGVLNYSSTPTYSSANLAAGATWNYVNGFSNNPAFNVPFTINGSFIKTGNGSMTFNSGATISGSGSLSFSGQVTIAINSDNPNFTGTITEISQGGGGFNIGHNGALGAGLLVFGANNNDIRSTVGGGYVAAYGSTYRFDASRTFGGNGVNMNFGSGAVTLNASPVLTVSNTTTFNGAIGETGGSRTFGKAGGGTLVLGGSASNTFTGLTSVTAGTLQLNKSGTANAIGAGGLSVGTGTTVTYTGASTDMIENTAPVTIAGTGVLNLNGVSDTIGTLGLTAAAANNAQVTTGAGTLTLGGTVTFTAATTGTAQISGLLDLGAATRTFNIGAGTGLGQDLLINAAISGSGVGLTKATGTGRLTLSNTNSYTGLTTVSAGTLIASNGGALGGGGGLTVNTGIFTYAPTAAGALNLGGGVLTLANGSAIGTVIGGTAGQSAITSSATASLSGTGVVNVRALPGVAFTTGTNDLITAAGGLTGGTYTLGAVFNNTNFTLSNFTRTATAISVDVNSATALSGNVFWKGGLAGNTGVWSASNGTTQSNWQVTDGVNQPLAPGATADLVFSTATAPGTMAGMTLGANMTVRTITINNTATAFSLNADGHALTITPSSSSTGITIGAGVQASSINVPVTLGAAQTWTNNSSNALTIGNAISQNGNSLTFAGTGIISLDTALTTISGAGGIIKNGTGQLNVNTGQNQAFTFTGDIVLNGGSIGFQNPSNFLTGKNTKITEGYIGGRFGSGFTWTSGLGTGANQIQITGGTSGFSGEGTTGSTYQIGTALSTLVWGALGEGTATGLFNPTILLANGPHRSNTNGVGALNNGIDLNGATRTITSTQTTNNAAGSGFTISGVISNSSATASGLTKTGVGNLILSAANTFNGLTTLSGGYLTLGNATALQNSVLDTTASISGTATAGLRTTATTLTLGGLSGNKNFAAAGGVFTSAAGGYGNVTALTLNPNSGVSASYAGVIANGAAGMTLTKTGAGTQTLTNQSTYTGATAVNAGTLVLGFGGVASNILPSGSALTLGGGTFQLTGTGTQTVNGLTTTAGTSSRILLDANETLTLGALTSAGAGSSLNFNTAAGGAAGATVGTGIITLTGGTLLSTWTVTDSTGFGLATRNGSNQIIRNTATTLLPASGGVVGTDYFIDNNAGGGAAPGSSTLAVTASQSAKSITVDTTAGSGVLTLNSGAVLSNSIWNFGGTGSNTYQITGSAGGAGLRTGATAETFIINNYNTGTVTFSSPILAFGANPLTVNGTGTTRLAATASTYTGATRVNGGILEVTRLATGSANSSIGNPASTAADRLLLGNGTTLRFVGDGSGNDTTDRNWTLNGTSDGDSATLDASGAGTETVTFSTTSSPAYGTSNQTRTINLAGTNTSNNTLAANIANNGTGAVSLTKSGSGTWVLTGSSTFTGTTRIDVGTLVLGHATNTIANTSAVNVNGGTLSIGANSDTVGTVTLTSGSITGTSGVLTGTSYDVRSGSISAILGGTGVALAKTTSGIVTLSSVSTYTGATTVSAGTLVVNGNISTSTLTTVQTGATLGGTGTLGAITINGILSPGNSIGTINALGDVTWNDNDAWAFELGSAASTLALANTTPGLSDLLNITGAGNDFIKGSGASFTFDFGGTGTAGWYKLVDWDSATTFVASDFFYNNLGGSLTGSFTVDSGTSALYLNVVPEPRAAMLGALGLLMLLRRRR
jgi:fibronectin-binding autotransporter adhesin